MRKALIYSVICIMIAFFLPTISLAQEKADTGKLKNQKSLNAIQVKGKFDEKMADKGVNAVKKMSQSIQSRGFKAENTYFGTETSFEQDGKTITNTLILQDYSKGNSKAAVGSVTVSDGTNQESYTFSLEKTGKNVTDVVENYINVKGEVEKANSWYSCLRKKIASICGSYASFDKCWSAYTSWTSFLGCITAITCGISAGPKAIACCTCDCSWVCKWAVGCCDR
jgi:hypothetical protein